MSVRNVCGVGLKRLLEAVLGRGHTKNPQFLAQRKADFWSTGASFVGIEAWLVESRDQGRIE